MYEIFTEIFLKNCFLYAEVLKLFKYIFDIDD